MKEVVFRVTVKVDTSNSYGSFSDAKEKMADIFLKHLAQAQSEFNDLYGEEIHLAGIEEAISI